MLFEFDGKVYGLGSEALFFGLCYKLNGAGDVLCRECSVI